MAQKISLLVVNYNGERYLREALDSVLTQTYPDFELLVWDDGSTDRSVAIAQAYAHQDRRVRVVAASHHGVAAARQAAIAQTTGTYLGWLDSDDLLASTALEETARALNAFPDTGLIYTDYLDIDAQGNIQRYGDRCHMPYSKEVLLLCFITFHFRLLRRSVFEQIGGINTAYPYAYDYDLCLRLSEVTTVRRLRKPLYYYRRHNDAISSQKQHEQKRDSCQAILAALQRRGLVDRYAQRLTSSERRTTEIRSQNAALTHR
ncbi:MAG TPA: glycosyltransferase [Candidatus Tectomicrobia bacterium]|jgi:glycosyltransferase involved in cell wall biosynthesis